MPEMTVLTTIADVSAWSTGRRRLGETIGFVPTMGYLHDGHASLIRSAADRCDAVVASIFVNPLQFAAGEDLEDYPRDLEHDTAVARDAGAHVVFAPDVREMYPRPPLTAVAVDEVSAGLEGASRPTHFSGVATVVAKLFSIIGPCSAFFGEKDFQQLAVVRRMVADLSIPVEVVGCPTQREPDGLAMSSRNVYLDRAQRSAARVLHDALTRACAVARERASRGHEVTASDLEAVMTECVADEPLADLDYAACVHSDDLSVVTGPLAGELRLLLAVRFGSTRLIDNLGLTLT